MPASVSSFLGRAKDLEQLSRLLASVRLVTLTGPPGIGKTRLSLEVGRKVAGDYPDGVVCVELAAMSEARMVPNAVAAALSLPELRGARLLVALRARLGERRLLLVLDNCEHVIAACAELVAELLRTCPGVRVLATSQEPLRITGEAVWQVPPLSLPSPTRALADSEAVRLFVERAGAVKAGFALSDDVAPAVAEICLRLDGIPLALELAAARAELLTPSEIARRLDDRFALLTEGSRSALPRHKTLLGALDWSHDLLTEPERALFRRLSVFRGGFTLDAATAVCGSAELDASEVFELLGRLLARSLVSADTDSSPEARYRLLETIAAYAWQRLQTAGEQSALEAAHARFYCSLAEAVEPHLTGPRQARWLERLKAERANMRAAIDRSLAQGETDQALRIAGSLVLFWRMRSHFSEGREQLEAVLAASPETPSALTAKALWGVGFMALMEGDLDGATPVLEQSLARFDELGDRQGQARALLLLGCCSQFGGGESQFALLEQSAILAREVGDSWCLGHALGIAGSGHEYRSELSAARPLLEECLRVARAAEERQSLRWGLLGLGSVALRQGDLGLAEALLEETLVVTEELGEDYSKATALQGLGVVALLRGDYGGARQVLDEALALNREVGNPFAAPGLLTLLARVTRAEGDFACARRLLEEALALARVNSLSPPIVLLGLGELATEEGDAAGARRLLEEALELARTGGDKGSTVHALRSLGILARAEGDPKRAAALHNEALGLAREIGSRHQIVVSLEAIAGLSAEAGRHEHAARLLGAAQGLRENHGYARPPSEVSRYEADLALVRQGLSAEALEAAFTQGAALSLEEAAAQASKGRGPRGLVRSGWPSLTERERQVAALVTKGLTNPEIAARLFISLATVKSHLSHIFDKLGLVHRRDLAREFQRHHQEPPDQLPVDTERSSGSEDGFPRSTH